MTNHRDISRRSLKRQNPAKGFIQTSSKGQMKMQQMAFMLVGLVLFFAMVGIIYFTLSVGSLRKEAQKLQEEEAREITKKLASSPELAFTSKSDCSNCIDLEKALMLADLLKTSGDYEKFWNLDYMMIERVYPKGAEVECTRFNFPDCNKITIINSTRVVSESPSFVALARWDPATEKYKYELGKIHTSGRKLI